MNLKRWTPSILLGAFLWSSFCSQTIASVDNFLPNIQWQLWSGVQFVPKPNASGTGLQSQASCASFTPANQWPTFNCSNTQAIRPNDLVISSIQSFWGFAGAGYINCFQVQCTQGYVTAARVSAVNPNTSISVASPGLGGISPTLSSWSTLLPVSPGDLGWSTNGADGWTKTETLIAGVDDWGASAIPASTVYPGAIRPLLLRKGITGQEIYGWSAPANQIKQFQGRTVTCGAAVYQRVQGGANSFNLHLDDSTGSSVSATGTGASFGGYQFITVTRTMAQNATSAGFYFNLLGNANDVFDIVLPTCAFTSSLAQSDLGQNSHELIRATSHWNPPLLTPDIINWPATELVTGSGLYGYNCIDIEAIGFGTMHNSVNNVYAKVEWKTGTVGAYVFMAPNVNTTNGLTFGPQTITIVPNVNNVAGGRWPLYHDGTGAIFGTNAGLSGIVGTWDLGDAEIGPGNPVD